MATSRRKFLQQTATAAAGFYIVPRHVLGRGFVPPSDKLNIASIGAGGKGTSDIANSWNNGANNIVAICDVDWARAKASFEKYPNAVRYKDFREMLDKEKGIDAVTVSTPDHQHAVAAMAAIQLGKHVYVQKPLTHDIYEARMLTEAARKYKVVSQMGNQGASNPSIPIMIDWFEKGKIGKVHTVHIWTNRPVWPQGIPVPQVTDKTPKKPDTIDWDLWVGTAPEVPYHPGYHPFKWRGWWEFGTGALGDMGCHLMDAPFRILGLGYPTEVECSVGSVFLKDWNPEWIPEGCPPSSAVHLKFPATAKNKTPLTMTWHDGGLRPFHPEWIPADQELGEPGGYNGVLMVGTKGIISMGVYGEYPKLYRKNGEVITPDPALLKVDVPEFGHHTAWTNACKAGFGSPQHKALTASFDHAGPLSEAVLMGNIAIRSYMLRNEVEKNRYEYPGRRKMLWDGQAMRITNYELANQFVKRTYRQGWSLGK